MFLYKNLFFNIYSFNPNHADWNQRRLFSGNLPGMFGYSQSYFQVLLSNESLPEFETMDYKTSLSRFIPHVCLPNIGIQTGVYQEIPHDEVSTPPPEAEGDTEVGEEGDFEEPGELNPDEQVNPREELVHGVPQTLQGDAENGQLNGEIPDDAAVLVNNIKVSIPSVRIRDREFSRKILNCRCVHFWNAMYMRALQMNLQLSKNDEFI